LTCARDLVAAGWSVLVVEKSRGVGGRCATRRMLGQPTDIGLTYYHADGASRRSGPTSPRKG